MRTILLDTQIFLWMQLETKKLPVSSERAIKSETYSWQLNQVSIWEIQIKYDLKKLELPESPRILIPRLIKDSGLGFEPIDNEAIFLLGKLPKNHRDPFDRLLISSAIVNGWELATTDALFEATQSL